MSESGKRTCDWCSNTAPWNDHLCGRCRSMAQKSKEQRDKEQEYEDLKEEVRLLREQVDMLLRRLGYEE